MSYVVLARKWRPMTFSDLVGQEHVATTLGNAIAMNRVAHAFLFTGVRGVGKTTSARILAKALNCEKGPTASPCLSCSQCTEISAGVDMDVQEIDAASRTGVDDIRELQERLVYRPSRDRFRIYIVDEVHMLSGSAWNAFLKTLEEPPPHVKFIFATTEVAKVPVTILSRCQRYDFKLIAANVVAARLRHVLAEEKIEADDGAVQILAREASGSMRDAMSLLDQVIAWAGVDGKLTAEGVSKALGVADSAALYRIARAIVSQDAAACLTIVAELADSGFDIGHLSRHILGVLRDLVVVRVAPDARALLSVPDADLADLGAIAGACSPDDLTRLHLSFSRAVEEILESPQPRGSLEMSLVRLARRPQLLPMDELLRRLADMEARLASGAPRALAPQRSQGGPVPQEGPADRRAPAADRPRPRPSEPSDDPEPAARSAPAFVAPSPPAPPAPPPPATRSEPPPSSQAPRSLPPASVPPASFRPGIFVPGKQALLDRAHPGFALLARLVDAVRPRSARVASLLERVALVEVTERALIVGLDARSFEAGFLTDPDSLALLDEVARRELGEQRVELADVVVGSEVPTLAKMVSEAGDARRAEVDHELRHHPLVQAAVQYLGAELRDVRLPTNVDAAPISLEEARVRGAQR